MNTSSLSFSNLQYLSVKTGFPTRVFLIYASANFLWKLSDIAFVYSLCTMMIILFQKIKNLDQIMRYKVGQSWSRLSPNCQILPKKEILLANLNVKFMYQLHPIMLPKISQISLQWIMRYKVTYIYGNLVETNHLSHSEIFFGKDVCYFCLPIVSYHNT